MATLKVQEVRCPDCGELLDIDPGRKIGFCPFCGAQLPVEEAGTNSFTYTYNENKTQHIIDEAKIVKEQRKAFQSEMGQIKSPLEAIVFIVGILALCGMLALMLQHWH